MSKEHAYAYEAGYRDGSVHYELEHCPACKNVADLQEALDENAKLRALVKDMWEYVKEYADCLDGEVHGQVWPTVTNGYGSKVRNGLGAFVGFPDRMHELRIEVDE